MSSGKNARGGSRKVGSGKNAPTRQKPVRVPTKKKKVVVFDARPVPEEPRTLRLGLVPGATPGKWISAWRDRMPNVTLELVHLSAADARDALVRDEADVVLLRLPINMNDVNAIALYDELPVVVMSVDSHLTATEELALADLAGEVVIVAQDDVLKMDPVAGTIAQKFTAPVSAEEAIATVATGVGITIVPMSIARAHHRKDVEHRRLTDGPLSPVGVAWHADRESPDIDTFVGIVRGRTVNSSR